MKYLFFIALFFTLLMPIFAQNNESSCPSISVTGPSSVNQLNEPMLFSASIGNENKNHKVTYKWTVDKGTIINGQGTTTIQVFTEGLSDTTVTATFEVEGLPKDCVNKDSETGVIVPKIEGQPLDSYDKISFLNELARFDAFLAYLSANPQSEGFVIIETDKNESFTDVKKHIRKLVKYIKERRIAPNRVSFAIAKSDLK